MRTRASTAVLEGLAFAAITALALYPSLFAGTHTAMAGNSWELADPSTSEWVFIPLFRAFREQLFGRGLLWSNARSLGMPTLASGVQAAPLHPLTLALAWLPEPIFWNALPLARLMVGGAAAYVLARRAMGFARLPSALFALSLGFGLHLLRWLNHAFLNGVASGLVCLCFAAEALTDESPAFGGRRWRALGQALASYALLTCGFPEATALGCVLVLLVALPLAVRLALRAPRALLCALAETFAAGLLALGLAAPQIFALTELVRVAGGEFRGQLGLQQFAASHLGSFLVEKVALPAVRPPGGPVVHAFGLVPLTFAALGLATIARQARRRPAWALGALLCAAFYFLKIFALWPALNRAVGSLPVLDRTWFTVYFFPLALYPFAWLVAAGAEALQGAAGEDAPRARGWSFAVAAAGALALAAWASHARLGGAWRESIGSAKAIECAALLGACAALGLFARGRRAGVVGLLIFACALGELCVLRPSQFKRLERFAPEAFGSPALDAAAKRATAALGLAPADVRVIDFAARADTRFAGVGLGSADDRASAALPARLRAFRVALFLSDWDGILPITGARLADAWSFTATRLFAVPDKLDPALHPPAGLRELAREGATALSALDAPAPRAFLAGRCAVADSPEAATRWLTAAARPAPSSAVIETPDAAERALCESLAAAPEAVHIDRDTGSEVALAPARGPAVLVLADTFYPGWHALDAASGRELAVRPANLALRAVVLPEAREYRVAFRYRPWWLPLALALSAAAIALGAALALWPRRALEPASRQRA